ncbi:MAG: ABC transporter permease [Bacteroidetes bacterium]|nr:ABC transporter permease [Bacteroidota bacterium]
MNTEFFISKKIISGNKGFSKPIVNIAILGIALGLIVMILTLAIVTGFQKEIREKVIGFGSHIQITNYENNESFESSSIDRNQPFLSGLKKNSSIKHIQSFATKAGIIKTKDELQGVIVKGIGSDFDWEFFKKNIVEGELFAVSDSVKSDKILISKFHKEKLKLKLNDTIVIYFIENQQQRARKFSISGIYSTGLGDMFDQVYVIADIAHIQKLNNWNQNQVAGFEVLLNDYEKLDATTEYVNETIGYNFLARSIKDLNRQIFSWLDAQDINAVVVIMLMALVAAINMISALLVLILERTNMIGILKALGMANRNVRKIFLYNAGFLIGRGLLLGNIIGISFCLLQKYFHLIPLDERTYYLSYIPINLNLLHVLLLNVGTFIVCFIMLLLPSYIITYITPVKAMRFT